MLTCIAVYLYCSLLSFNCGTQAQCPTAHKRFILWAHLSQHNKEVKMPRSNSSDFPKNSSLNKNLQKPCLKEKEETMS